MTVWAGHAERRASPDIVDTFTHTVHADTVELAEEYLRAAVNVYLPRWSRLSVVNMDDTLEGRTVTPVVVRP